MSLSKNENTLQDWFISHNKTLALAESCTGGLIASALTKIPGSSAYFLGSIVAYSNLLKTSLLHVKEETLEKYGAVSKQTAEEMVEGLFKIIPCDYALSVTGVAGPAGGSQDKPVGTVWGAIAQRGHPIQTISMQLKGSRTEIQEQAKELLLNRLLELTV